MKFFGTGRRKSAIARVTIEQIVDSKSDIIFDAILINKKKVLDYFQKDQSVIQTFQKYLKIIELKIPIKISISVSGGGVTSQKEAIYLAFVKALCKIKNEFNIQLRKKSLLTQDSRIKERKKYGLKKARKAPQYSKR